MSRTLLQLVQAACSEMGLQQPLAVFGNPDPNISQILALASREGRQFINMASDKGGWAALRTDRSFNLVPSQTVISGSNAGATCTLVCAAAHGLSVGQTVCVVGATPAQYNGTAVITAVDGTGTQFSYVAASPPSGAVTAVPVYSLCYPLPDDFQFMLPQTLWDRNFRWQALGPLSAQEWNVLQYGISPAGPRLRFQIRGNLIYINPPPGPTQTDLIAFTYISQSWCQSAAGVLQELWSADTDTYLLDEDCFIMGLQWRFKKAKGFAYQADLDDYNDTTATALARDGGSRSLPLNASGGNLHLLGSANVPDTGFGT